jgi:thiosulfate/3-mercaptopyruvate sulfurtransferase
MHSQFGLVFDLCPASVQQQSSLDLGTNMSKSIEERGYVRPELLVSTDWVARHLEDPNVRIAESNEDPLLYSSGHVPGAVEIDWTRDLNNPVRRDYLGPKSFEALMRRIGATPDTTIVLYGDKNNWWATYAFWVLQLFGHTNARIMDGGRLKWINEKRPVSRETPSYPATEYETLGRDDIRHRAFRDHVMKHVERKLPLVDVRSPEEYRGERLHMPDYPNEGALRGGHIPGALSIPWARAVNQEDGTFKTADELRKLYIEENKLRPDDDVIAYCRIGERSSHTWFVLTYLLGFKNVRNYDGSWTEWGNLVNAPIENPSAAMEYEAAA